MFLIVALGIRISEGDFSASILIFSKSSFRFRCNGSGDFFSVEQRRQSHSNPQFVLKDSRRTKYTGSGDRYAWVISVPAGMSHVAVIIIMFPMKA